MLSTDRYLRLILNMTHMTFSPANSYTSVTTALFSFSTTGECTDEGFASFVSRICFSGSTSVEVLRDGGAQSFINSVTKGIPI